MKGKYKRERELKEKFQQLQWTDIKEGKGTQMIKLNYSLKTMGYRMGVKP